MTFRGGELGARSFALVFNLPSAAVILFIIAYPIAYSFWISLHRYNLMRPFLTRFVGLNNYWLALHEERFWNSLGISLYFVAVSLLLVVTLGFAIALLLDSVFVGRAVLRSLLMIPWAIPPVVNGLVWAWIYNGSYGALNGLLTDLHLISSPVNWLIRPSLALNMVVFAYVWNQVPFAVILILAALQAIPRELYEAAEVDAAGPIQRFLTITLPWCLHSLLIVLIYQTMLGFRVFDIIYTLTAGGPGNATEVIAWQTYLISFTHLDFGLGNAYAHFITLITMALTLLYIRLLYRRGLVL